MKLGDYLKSINTSKEDVCKASGSEEAALRLYPRFVVARALSYHQDCVLLVNELNTKGLGAHGVTNRMHYDFMLHVIPKGNRFSKMTNTKKDEKIKTIMEVYGYSHQKALEVVDLIDENDLETLKNKLK